MVDVFKRFNLFLAYLEYRFSINSFFSWPSALQDSDPCGAQLFLIKKKLFFEICFTLLLEKICSFKKFCLSLHRKKISTNKF